jgi:hypothetical protein
MELRIIDFSIKHFECGGRKFYVRDSLSFARYRELQKLNLQFGYSGTFYDVYNNVKTAYECLNTGKPADGAVILYNILKGIVELDEKYDPVWKLCALFIDENGEDPTVYDEGKMGEKIECWGKELDSLPFFQLASNLVPGWMDVYKKIIQDGLLEEKRNESIL